MIKHTTGVSRLPQKILAYLLFNAFYSGVHIHTSIGTFMDHDTRTKFLYNMGALRNIKSPMCDIRCVLCNMKSALCNICVLW